MITHEFFYNRFKLKLKTELDFKKKYLLKNNNHVPQKNTISLHFTIFTFNSTLNKILKLKYFLKIKSSTNLYLYK